MVILGFYAQFQGNLATNRAATAQVASTHEAEQAATARAASTLAIEQRDRSRGGELAALALMHLDDKPENGLLLSVEAYRTANTFQTRSALYKIWQYRPRLIRILQVHDFHVSCIAFGPDGKTLAFGSTDGTIQMWNSIDGLPLGEPLSGHLDFVTSMAFSPDGKTLASGGIDGSIILWNIDSNHPIRTFVTDLKGGVTSIAFSPDGKTLASGIEDGTIQLWDVEDGHLVRAFYTGYLNWTEVIVFSPNGKVMASGHLDGNVRLWDIASGQLVNKSIGASSPIIEGFTGTQVAPQEAGFRILSIAFSPDGNILASGSWDGFIQLWDAATGQPFGEPLISNSSSIFGLAFSSDGKMLFSSNKDGSIWQWNTTDPNYFPRELFDKLPMDVTRAVFSPGGKILAFGSVDGNIWLWDIANKQPLRLQISKYSAEAIAFSPDSEILANWSASDGIIRLWDVKSGQQLSMQFDTQATWIDSMKFSPDGKLLALGRDDGIVQLWDIESGQLHGEPLIGHIGRVDSEVVKVF